MSFTKAMVQSQHNSFNISIRWDCIIHTCKKALVYQAVGLLLNLRLRVAYG